MRRRVVTAVVSALAAGVILVAQDGSLSPFSSSVQLVEIYATVSNERGEVVADLGREAFEVYEDGQRQDVSVFAAGEFPLTVALGVDRSWSMAGQRLEMAKRASQSFLARLKPGDRSMVVAISSDAEVVAPLSADRPAQIRAIAGLDPWSTTALRDAIVVALDRLGPEPGRQALVIFSDGNDRYSIASEGEVISRARQGGALIYPIALGTVRPPLLAELAVLTGGRSFLLKDAKDLERTLGAISTELHSQYLLGYVPRRMPSPGGRDWRAIRVTATQRGATLHVRARDGYTAR